MKPMMLLLLLSLSAPAWADEPPAPAPTAEQGGEEAPAPAAEQEEEAPLPEGYIPPDSPPYRLSKLGLVAGLLAGVDLSQPFNTYGTSPSVGVEVGFTPDALERRLQLTLTAQWLKPGRTNDIEDPRFSEAVHEETTVNTLRVMVGALYRYKIIKAGGLGQIALTAGGGAMAWLYEIEQEAKAGAASFGKDTETGTAWGAVARGGLEWFRGPGAVVIEAMIGLAPSGDMGALNFNLGWRHFF